MNKQHKLKCVPFYYQLIVDGVKPFEVRNNDRDFQVGDTILLQEYLPNQIGEGVYTGREIELLITYILDPKEGPAMAFYGLEEGFVAMAIRILPTHFIVSSGRANRKLQEGWLKDLLENTEALQEPIEIAITNES